MKRFDLVLFLLILALFSASWDIFLQVNIGHVNFRFTQLVFFLLILICLIKKLSHGRQIKPLGFDALLLWTFFMIIFIPHTSFLLRNILYVIWLLFSVISIYILVQIIQTPKRLEQVIRWYIYSFVFVGAFGLIQFAAGFMGISLLTMQWFIPGLLARINGFNYEPSFFAIYMVQGFILIAYLKEKKSQILSPKKLKVCYFLILIALIASTSRGGWLIVLLWFSRPLFFFLQNLFKGMFSSSNINTILLKFLLPATFVITYGIFLIKSFALEVLFMGVGLLGSSDHSISIRLTDYQNMLTVFTESPLIGYSLGGISPAVGALGGFIVTTNEQAKNFEGAGVALELLVASGCIGIIPLLFYIYNIFKKPWDMLKKMPASETKIILASLLISLFFTLIILQTGQNILRIHIWYHLGLISAAYGIGKKASISIKNSISTDILLQNRFKKNIPS